MKTAYQMSLFDLVDSDEDKNEQFIDDCIRQGSNFEDGIWRINRYIELNQRMNEFPEWLKNEYGWGGSVRPDGESIQHSSKGWECENTKTGFSAKLTWMQVAERILRLAALGKYYTEQDEKAHQRNLDYHMQHLAEGRFAPGINITQERYDRAKAGDRTAFEYFRYLTGNEKDIDGDEE